MRLLLACLWVFACSGSTYLMGQQPYEHIPLRSSGQIPAEFLTSSTYKYLHHKAGIPKKEKAHIRKAKQRFYLHSSFSTDELLLSGKVLFNDSLSNYINRVADVLLQDQPELRNSIRFYVMKSPLPNAFTTHRGTIFINLGLMARLENEAQLAYILAHEIAHYTHQHVLNRYLNDHQTQRLWKHSQPGLSGAKEMLQSNYSQDSELQADLAGLQLLSSSPYQLAEILPVYDMLQHARQPLQAEQLDWNMLYNPYLEQLNISALARLQTNSTYRAASPGHAHTDIPSYLTTHPDPVQRKRLLSRNLPPEAEGELFVVSQNEFVRLLRKSQAELAQLFLEQAAYHDALYHLFFLREQLGPSPYFDKQLCKTLYGIAKYKLAGQALNRLLDYPEDSIDARQLETFIDDMSAEEAVLMAFTHLWTQYRQHPSDAYYRQALRDLLADFPAVFPDFPETQGLAACFGQLAAEPEFEAFFAHAQPLGAQEKPTVAPQKKKKKKKQGKQLGIHKVVVFNPRFSRIDERPRQMGVQYLATERQQALLDSYILSTGQKLGLDIVLLDSKFISPDSRVEHFNDIATLANWHQEKLLHGEIDMVCSNYEELLPLVEKYETPYFAQLGAISLRSPIEVNQRLKWLALLVAPPLWPYGIYEMVKPHEASIFYSLVYNLQYDQRIAVMSDIDQSRVSNKGLYRNIYHDLRQMKMGK